MMLRPEDVQEVRRLLGEKRLSYRQIAKEVGVSRGSVSLIANGKRPDYADEDDLAPQGPFVKCGGCGSKVQLPCQICRARARAHAIPGARLSDGPPEDLGLQLGPDELARYEEIRHLAPKTKREKA